MAKLGRLFYKNITSADSENLSGRRSEAIIADVTSESDVERLIETVVDRLGELNVSC